MKILIPLQFFAFIVATNAFLRIRDTASGPVAASAVKRRLPVLHDVEIHRSLPTRPGPPRPVNTVHSGCEFLAFSKRSFKTVDLLVSTSMRTPAECISWLKNNMNTYQAVEYNLKSSTCRAVKLAKWNNTISNRNSTLFAQKPKVFGNPSALLWYQPFDANYGRISEHHIINIHKKIRQYVRRLPAHLRLHVERILISAYRSKLAIKEAAKKYHNKYSIADKKMSTKFEAWWIALEKHMQAAVKFIDGKVKIKSYRIGAHGSHRNNQLKKHKKQAVKKVSHSVNIPAEKKPFVTSIVNLVNSAKMSLLDAAKKVHSDALKAGTVKQDFNIWWRSMNFYTSHTMRANSLQSKKIPSLNRKHGGIKIAIKASKP